MPFKNKQGIFQTIKNFFPFVSNKANITRPHTHTHTNCYVKGRFRELGA